MELFLRLHTLTWVINASPHIQELIDTGQVKDFAEVAQRGHITRARVTQIMNLLLLAPDIQEEILFLPRTTAGVDQIRERTIRALIAESSFKAQRHAWRELQQQKHRCNESASTPQLLGPEHQHE